MDYYWLSFLEVVWNFHILIASYQRNRFWGWKIDSHISLSVVVDAHMMFVLFFVSVYGSHRIGSHLADIFFLQGRFKTHRFICFTGHILGTTNTFHLFGNYNRQQRVHLNWFSDQVDFYLLVERVFILFFLSIFI